MSFCLAELYLWSFRNSLQVPDTDIGTYQLYEKGEPASPTDQHYYNEKQQFADSRGYPWFLSNRRPEKLRDALMELEELLQSCPVMSVRWRSKQCCQLLLRSGVLVTLILGGAQVERVAIDRTLVGGDYLLTPSYVSLTAHFSHSSMGLGGMHTHRSQTSVHSVSPSSVTPNGSLKGTNKCTCTSVIVRSLPAIHTFDGEESGVSGLPEQEEPELT
ncbi:WD repeat-containing and planar cell polarity effector protein fritz homolog [Cyprinus carpio]|uniref:WD repeat-containing and planar cell polarity effector protein fritz homolog n=1 Tax=Cyprinus carpio TaxID=7962 RepID=A0A9Q9YZN1_CYPCA|nr:WD repeat-containing and planar cell polarity effector protein fritz homolog [Cyprinus carpio]